MTIKVGGQQVTFPPPLTQIPVIAPGSHSSINPTKANPIFNAAIQVAAATVGQNLVSVQPMVAPTGQLFFMDPKTIQRHGMSEEMANKIFKYCEWKLNGMLVYACGKHTPPGMYMITSIHQVNGNPFSCYIYIRQYPNGLIKHKAKKIHYITINDLLGLASGRTITASYESDSVKELIRENGKTFRVPKKIITTLRLLRI